VSSPAPQVDLHAHVLPGVDDGAADESQALSMLERAAADGTRIIAATPHAGRCRPEAIIEGVRQLNAWPSMPGWRSRWCRAASIGSTPSWWRGIARASS
jgi:hypothetical protein